MVDTQMNKNNNNWYLPTGQPGTLLWISKPYYSKREEGPLKIIVYFRMENGSIRKSYLAWSRLPTMWLGAKYESYKPIESVRYQVTYELYLSQMKNCIIKEAVECIPTWLITFKQLDLLSGHTKCFTFEVNEKIYVVPCFEVVRCLFGQYSFILNRLLHSGGLYSFIESEYADNKKLCFNFSNEFKRSNIKPSMLSELAWILHTEEVYTEWENIYSEFVRAKCLVANIPTLPAVKMKCSGIETTNKGQKIMFVQFAQLVNRDLPFDEITYTHPQKYQDETLGINDGSDNKNIIQVDDYDEDFADSAYATDGNGKIVLMQMSHNTFKKIPSIKNITEEKSSSINLIKNRNHKEEKQMALTTNESAVGGIARSVEYDSVEVSKTLESPEDFRKFVSDIECLRRRPLNLIPTITYHYLEGDTSICFMENGQRRKWAFVTMSYKGKAISLIEVDVSDGLSLSTLIMLSETNNEKIAQYCIEKLINDQSWNKEWLKSIKVAKIDTLKHHPNRSPKRWAELIRNHI